MVGRYRGPALSSHRGHPNGASRVAVDAVLGPRIEGDVVPGRNGISRQGSREIRAVQDIPTAALFTPEHPSVAQPGSEMSLADHEPATRITELVTEPKSLCLAITRLPPCRHRG